MIKIIFLRLWQCYICLHATPITSDQAPRMIHNGNGYYPTELLKYHSINYSLMDHFDCKNLLRSQIKLITAK